MSAWIYFCSIHLLFCVQYWSHLVGGLECHKKTRQFWCCLLNKGKWPLSQVNQVMSLSVTSDIGSENEMLTSWFHKPFGMFTSWLKILWTSEDLCTSGECGFLSGHYIVTFCWCQMRPGSFGSPDWCAMFALKYLRGKDLIFGLRQLVWNGDPSQSIIFWPKIFNIICDILCERTH